MAVAAPTNAVFRDAFARLTAMGIRLFTTESLFDETREHYWFAERVIKNMERNHRKLLQPHWANLHIEKQISFWKDFIRWQAAGNPARLGCLHFFRLWSSEAIEGSFTASIE